MTNTQMKSCRHVEVRPGPVVHANVAEFNERSLDGAKYFVIFIDGASGFVRAIHMKIKGEADELLKEHVVRRAKNRIFCQ